MTFPVPSHPIHQATTSGEERLAVDVLAEVAEAIRSAQSFLITSHVGPDGDALGSCVALALGLRSLGKDARAVIGEGYPERYRPLLPAGVLDIVSPEALGAPGCADWFITLDTNEPDRVGGLKSVFYGAGSRQICVDHHRTQVFGRHSLELILPTAPATGSLVLALLDTLEVELTRDIAQALWIAIATDTGWFRFSNTDEWALLDAARLATYGLDVETLYDSIYHDLSVTRAHLVGHVLRRVHAEFGGDFVWSHISCADRGDTSLTELDGVVDYLKTIHGARIIAMIVETQPGSYKVSLRARQDVEVEGLARSFGGGGHAKAAGCRFTGPREELIEELRKRAGEELSRHAGS